MRTTGYPHRGTIEALLVPRRAATTRWGPIPIHANAPSLVLGDGFAAWLATRDQGAVAPVIVDRARIAELVIEEGVHAHDAADAIRTGQSGGLLATTWRAIDGTAPVTLDVEASLDDAAARWRQHVDAHRAAVTEKLGIDLEAKLADRTRFEMPPAAEEVRFAPTWDSRQRRLIARYVLTVSRTARERQGKRQRACPPNRPASSCRDVEVRTGWHAIGKLALEVTFDRTGKLIDSQVAGPEHELVEVGS